MKKKTNINLKNINFRENREPDSKINFRNILISHCTEYQKNKECGKKTTI